MFSSTRRYRSHYRAQFNQLKSSPGEEFSIPLDVLRTRLRKQRSKIDLRDDQIEALLREADKNGDERITVEEFEELVTSKEAQSSQVKRALYFIADQVITHQQRVEVHSYIDEYTCCPPPLFVLLITIIEICVFFYYYYTESMPPNEDIFTFCAGCHVDNHIGPLVFAPKLRAQVWRFFTYAFLHVGLLHLLGNMAVQIIIGVPLEVVHKPWRIAPLYVMAVLTGALLQYTLDPKVYVVGASAGVYALLTAHLANIFINWAEMPYRWVRLGLISVFLIFDIATAIYRRICLNDCDSVSHSAHIAGGVTGFCFGVVILYNIVERPWERIIKYVCIALYVAFVAFTIALTIFQEPESSA
ncbi:Serine-type endopeptidase, partial [Trichostrongylus colubriformis]